eukprot:6131140-Ditylum_brightwellii.AAC.1
MLEPTAKSAITTAYAVTTTHNHNCFENSSDKNKHSIHQNSYNTIAYDNDGVLDRKRPAKPTRNNKNNKIEIENGGNNS